MDISWVASLILFNSCIIMELFKQLISSTLLDSKDLQGRNNGLLLNASCSPIMLSPEAYSQLVFSKCELVDGLYDQRWFWYFWSQPSYSYGDVLSLQLYLILTFSYV